MKKIFIFLIGSILLMGCGNSITLLNAVKQTTIPGRPNLKKYNNYVIDFSYNKNTPLTIKGINVYEAKKLYTTKFLLKKKGDTQYLKSINSPGTYTLEIPLKTNNILNTSSTTKEQNYVTISYLVKGKQKELKITEFKTKTVTKR